jgi:hypothetical protein
LSSDRHVRRTAPGHSKLKALYGLPLPRSVVRTTATSSQPLTSVMTARAEISAGDTVESLTDCADSAL